MHWKDIYTYEAGQENSSFSRFSEQQLIKIVEGNNVGRYFSIWQVLAKKGTVAHAAKPMWRYLQRNPGKHYMLNRYHCSAALFQILGIPDPASNNDLRKQVQWDSHGEQTRQEALLRLKAIIEEQQSTTK